MNKKEQLRSEGTKRSQKISTIREKFSTVKFQVRHECVCEKGVKIFLCSTVCVCMRRVKKYSIGVAPFMFLL